MREFYNKYVNWIVIILFIMVCAKSCRSCALESRSTWDNVKRTEYVDSLTYRYDSIYNNLYNMYKSANDSFVHYKQLYQSENKLNYKLKSDIEYFRKINSKLINVVEENK